MKVLSFFFLGILVSSVNANSIKIGFINTEKVVNNLSLYQKSISEIANEFEPKKQELLDLFNHIKLLRSKVESIGISDNSESANDDLITLNELEESFKVETELWQKLMDSQKKYLLTKIEDLINSSINEFAIEEGYDLILYKDIAFASEKVNITQEIIEKIEKLSP
jgi:outer membrane protein|tara:strand:+ start:1997 stop:2494 length:498 start_codon:yes stop_codon:yes gene_type:complete